MTRRRLDVSLIDRIFGSNDLRILTHCAATLFAIATFASASPAATLTRQQIDQCKGNEPAKVTIAACTAVIKSGRWRGKDLVWAYEHRGNAYYDSGDNDRAIADYTEAIRLDPKEAFAYNDRGNAYQQKGDYPRAIADYTEAIRINPNYVNAYVNRCWLYLNRDDTGDQDRAVADCSEAIRLDPKDARAYYYRGHAYNNKRDYDHAIADYSETIRLNPNHDGGNAFFERGKMYLDKGDFDTAIGDFTEIMKRDPKAANYYFYRGVANLYAGAVAKSLADIDQATALAPKWAYGALWLEIVDKRSNLPSRMQQAIAQLDMTAWPAPLLKFFLGELTPDAVEAAADDPDAAKKTVRLCDANFFIGEFSLFAGRKDEAARRFQAAAQGCYDPELAAAKAELKALGKSP